MEHVIVEREFEEPIDFDSIQTREDTFRWCLDQHGVTFLRSFFSRDRKRMICVYRAPDAEAVRQTQRKAKMPYTRIWTTDIYPAE